MRERHMMRYNYALATLAICTSLPVAAQTWEVGAGGGGSFYTDKTIESTRGTAETGFKTGFTVTGWLGHTSAEHFGGEIHYTWAKNDIKLSSGGTSTSFASQAHMIYYDFLIYPGSNKSKFRPYFAVGGGMKGYQGTGTERAVQPLIQYAALTKTTDWRPMVSAGAGIKWTLGERLVLRIDVHDFMTPFPEKMILPTPPNKVSGWIHNIVPSFGISYLF